MTFLFIVICGAVFLFGFVVFFGAPYLPTLKANQKTALDLLNLKPGQTLLELGSGDGRMLIAAAEKGIRAVGYELNPLLWLYSWIVTRKYGRLVRVRCDNFWRGQLPVCDGMYVFLLDRYMTKLDTKITQEIPNSIRLVTFAFKIPGKTPISEMNGMFLYEYRSKKSKRVVR